MSRLLITVGLDSTKSSADPKLVYLGRSGAAQSAAEAASPFARLLRLNHAVGIPKNNPRASANAALLASAPGKKAKKGSKATEPVVPPAPAPAPVASPAAVAPVDPAPVAPVAPAVEEAEDGEGENHFGG